MQTFEKVNYPRGSHSNSMSSTRLLVVKGCPPAEPFPLWSIVDRKDYVEVPPWVRERMAKEEELFVTHQKKLKEEWDKKSEQT